MASNPVHQFSDRDAQRLGNTLDVSESDIPLAPFNAADVRAIQFAFVRKPFLRIALLFPQLSDSLSKPYQDVRSFRHAPIGYLTTTIIPRTISIYYS